MRFRPIAIVAATVALLAGTSSVSASSEHFNPPKQYYLALGDSLAYGFEQAKFDAELATGTFDASTFTGYAGDFATLMKAVRPGLQEANLGCPGETTASYSVAGGCPTPSILLHVHYVMSQRDAALAFLHAHRGQVSPITLDLGANDLTPCRSSSDPSCFPSALAHVATNLRTALGELRAAAPNAEIIVMQYYNPLYVVAPSTDVLVGQLNRVIAEAAAPFGARLANAFPVINQNPAFPSEGLAVCGLTGMCVPAPGGDIHPNDAGYLLIGQQFWVASGYSRLGD